MDSCAPARAESTGLSHGVAEVLKADAETILLVEDEPFVREVTCEVLRSAGYRVLAAKNAIEGTREFNHSEGKIDLLLADVVQPGETGRALAAKLRQQHPGLNVLLVTGYAEQMELCEAGSVEVLAKPFATGMLLRRVREAIDRGLHPAGAREEPAGNEVRHACGNA